jgi:hypothetical protein
MWGHLQWCLHLLHDQPLGLFSRRMSQTIVATGSVNQLFIPKMGAYRGMVPWDHSQVIQYLQHVHDGEVVDNIDELKYPNHRSAETESRQNELESMVRSCLQQPR